MHRSSYEEMGRNVKAHLAGLKGGARVLDLGSADVNGNYRALIEERGLVYVGADLAKGANVDLVMPSEFATGLPDASVDAVISGQTLEHCRNPFRLVAEAFRVCRPGAPCLLVAPWVWKEHKHPWDCWRILPDGMRATLEQAGFFVVKTYLREVDCWGIGRKPAPKAKP